MNDEFDILKSQGSPVGWSQYRWLYDYIRQTLPSDCTEFAAENLGQLFRSVYNSSSLCLAEGPNLVHTFTVQGHDSIRCTSYLKVAGTIRTVGIRKVMLPEYLPELFDLESPAPPRPEDLQIVKH